MPPAFPECVPVLTDGVVTLRAHQPQDADRIAEQCQDRLTWRFTTVPHPYGPQDAHSFLGHVQDAWNDPAGSRYWAVTDATDAFHGSLDLRFDNDGRASIGVAPHPQAWGRGLMARAVRLACGWAFAHGTEVIHWAAVAGNWASRRVAWACGFTMHGLVPGLLGSGGRGVHDGWLGTLRRTDAMTPQGHWFDPPVLQGASLRLRPWRDDDAGHLVDPDADAQRFMPWGAAPFVADFAGWMLARDTRMADGEGIYWCIADRDTDRPAGHLQLFRLDQTMSAGSAEVGYWLLPRERGRARMGEALGLLRGFAFGSPGLGGLGLHRLAAGTDAANTASNAVLRRAGFTQIGVEHEIMAGPDGTHSDGLLWELMAGADAPGGDQAPTIEGTAVRLRSWRRTDAGGIVQACTDAQTRHWLAGLPDPYDEDTALAYVEHARACTASGAAVYWAVAAM
ncbi:MAG TPA: GNAT family N-acetyltransferase, partial [Candidatus Lustribacter sp.]|nr:GNAT family N-acetyltransferase [Candidatus Lustribacter sp.]